LALSTLRCVFRPLMQLQCQVVAIRCTAPMAMSAHEEMKKFWKKNTTSGRPSSPWIIFWPHLPMMTSLTHRTTGIIMGVALYGISLGLLAKSGDFPSYIEAVKNLHIATPVMWLGKGLIAFPLVYHYINGIRHLSWDAGKGFEMKTQYKTGYLAFGSAITLSALIASITYIM